MAAICHPNLIDFEPAPRLRLVVDRPVAPSTYRRRRIAVVGALAVLVLALLAAVALLRAPGASMHVGTTHQAGAAPVIADLAALSADVPSGATYVVHPGDTLWTIARAIHPGGDVRAAVDQLAELNGGAAIAVGQRLRLA
jgi:hypothetical protein